MKKLTASIILIFILLLSTSIAAAADYSGTDIRLSEVKGTVKVENAAGKAIAAKDNLRICDGYKVYTGADGTVYIKLDNSKAVMLQQSSEIIVKKTGSKLAVVLNKGTVSGDISKKLNSSETMDIHTTTMVTGVRGTSWTIQAFNTLNSIPASIVDVLEGQVEVSLKGPDKAASTSTVLLKAGYSAEVVADPRSEKLMSPQLKATDYDIPLWLPAAEGGISLGEGVIPDPVYKQFVITNGTVNAANLPAQTVLNIKDGLFSDKVMDGMPTDLKEDIEAADYDELRSIVNAKVEEDLAVSEAAENAADNLSKIENDNVFSKQEELKADRETILLDKGQGESVSIPSTGGSNRPQTYTVTINDNNVAVVAAINGSSSTVTAGGSFEFSVSLKEGYRGIRTATVPTVTAGNTALTPTGNGAESYITNYKVDGINENLTINVAAGMDTDIDAATLGKLLESGDVVIPSGTTVSIGRTETLTVPAGRSLSFSSGSALSNSGDITVNGTMDISSANADAVNFGTITVNSSNSLHILSGGSLDNMSDIIVSSTGLMDIAGTFNNSGTVNVAQGGSFKVLDGGQVNTPNATINLPILYVNEDGSQSQNYVTAAYGDEYSRIKANPTRSGYIFRGWVSEGGSKITAESVTGTDTLTAQWIKFDINVDKGDYAVEHTYDDTPSVTADTMDIKLYMYPDDVTAYVAAMPYAKVNGRYQYAEGVADDQSPATIYTYNVSLEEDLHFEAVFKDTITASDLEEMYASEDSLTIPYGVNVVIDKNGYELPVDKTLILEGTASQEGAASQFTVNAGNAFTNSGIINSVSGVTVYGSLTNKGAISGNTDVILLTPDGSVINDGGTISGAAGNDWALIRVIDPGNVGTGTPSITINGGTLSAGSGAVFAKSSGLNPSIRIKISINDGNISGNDDIFALTYSDIVIDGGTITSDGGTIFNVQNTTIGVTNNNGNASVYAKKSASVFKAVDSVTYEQPSNKHIVKADSGSGIAPSGYAFSPIDNTDGNQIYVLMHDAQL